jgi:hypothetical protein
VGWWVGWVGGLGGLVGWVGHQSKPRQGGWAVRLGVSEFWGGNYSARGALVNGQLSKFLNGHIIKWAKFLLNFTKTK